MAAASPDGSAIMRALFRVACTSALLASLTIVYALEIVKLANPRVKRREAREREDDVRKSAPRVPSVRPATVPESAAAQ